MADVAQLGIAVDSSQVKAGAAELRAFEYIAKRTGETVEQVQKRLASWGNNVSGAAAQTRAMAAASGPANEQLVRMAANTDRTNVAMGRLFGVTIGAVAARATRDLVRYGVDLNKTLADSADTADRLGISYQKFQGLSTAAAYKGVTGNDFNAGMLKFNEQIDLARNGLGSLQGLLRANGKTVGDTATTFGIVADLVRNAGSEAQKFSILQQAGLPASREFVQLMEQGSAAINKQSDAAKKLTDAQLAEAKRINEEWNKAWVDIDRLGRSAFVSVFETAKEKGGEFWETTKREFNALKGLAQSANRGWAPQAGDGRRAGDIDFLPAFPAGRVDRGSDLPNIGKTNPNATVDPERLKQLIALEQQRIGILGQTASVSEQVRAVELQIQTARLNNVSVSNVEAENLKRLARERALGITQIKSSADAYGVELQTIGMTTGAAAAYTAVQNKLNEARRNGQVLTQDNIDAIKREAENLGNAAQAVEDVRFRYDTFKSTFVSFGQYLRQGEGAWAAFKHAGVDALGKIGDKLMSMAADNLWKSAFGGSTGGLGSLFGSLFGGGGGTNATDGIGGYGPTLNHSGYGPGDPPGPTRYVHPAYFDHAPRFHSGIGPGERPAIIRNDESVLTPGQMRQLRPASAGPQSVHVTVGVSIDKNGNLDAYVKDISERISDSRMAKFTASRDFQRVAATAANEGNRKGYAR